MCILEKSAQLNTEKASHCARHRMSPKRMFQKVEPFYICAYRQVYKCTGKKKAGAKHNSYYCIICVF